ncbi:MAG: hypothetical protein ACREX0_16860 [Noviherbaspirillum sp.]
MAALPSSGKFVTEHAIAGYCPRFADASFYFSQARRSRAPAAQHRDAMNMGVLQEGERRAVGPRGKGMARRAIVWIIALR